MGPAGAAPVRVPLRTAPAQKCNRTLVPGEVKRCVVRGPLVGYYLACPACKFIGVYLHEKVGYVEEPAETFKFPKTLVGMQTPPSCTGCNRTIRVEGRFVEAS